MTAAALALLWLVVPGDEVVRVTATASKTDVRVGEAFALELVAAGPPGAVFEFPKQAGNDAVELRDAALVPGDASPPSPPTTHRYEAMALAVGEVELPAIAVAYRLPDGTSGTASTELLRLRVESVLPKDPKQQKLADIRGPLPLSVGIPFWIALAVLLLLTAAALIWLHRRRRPAPATLEPAPRAPDLEALAALERLAASGLVARGEYRAYYIALAEIAKGYLGRRLQAPVLEMTTTEMGLFLRDHPQAAPFATSVRELASAADRIKFARGAGLEDEAKRHLEAASALVRGLEDKLRPREQAA